MPSKAPTIIRSISSMQREAASLNRRNIRIGFVPTMGALHAGHAALFRRAAKSSDVVIASIFVNPTQFSPSEDLAKYPRQLKADSAVARDSGVRYIFAPNPREFYPSDFQSWVEVASLTSVLEGGKRPTHFRGVTTVVAKLFNIVRPQVVVFGMKDFQQSVVLRQMTRDLGYPIQFIVAPTVREHDGLALSSRNRYLSATEREAAPAFFQALRLARKLVREGERRTRFLERIMRRHIQAHAPTARVDYLSFNRISDLSPVVKIEKGTVCSGALYFGSTRLIDNIKLW